eukprot:6463624-Amphidinium_carterae.2
MAQPRQKAAYSDYDREGRGKAAPEDQEDEPPTCRQLWLYRRPEDKIANKGGILQHVLHIPSGNHPTSSYDHLTPDIQKVYHNFDFYDTHMAELCFRLTRCIPKVYNENFYARLKASTRELP